MSFSVHTGDCRAVMATMPDASVDAIVTDPPYELGFMGKAWDRSGIAYDAEVWAQALRVLKPGGHLIAFGGTRTCHRMACAIEDAGFEVRDQVLWLYGSGFPKSLDVSKAIDAALGTERDVVGDNPNSRPNMCGVSAVVLSPRVDSPLTAPATPEAIAYNGWGTALKPAHEPAVLARKPLIGTVAANVLEHGTGGLNIAGCRIGDDGGGTSCANRDASGKCMGHKNGGRSTSGETFHGPDTDAGRWPANLIHDGSEAIDRILPGGNARYFYSAKASRDDRDDGLEGFAEASGAERSGRKDGSAGIGPRSGAQGKGRNTHPTVKPTALMRYLCRLVTPPGGLILDPFCGSGSTGRAALLEGFQFIGIELLEHHAEIARARIAAIKNRGVQVELFGDIA